jgi:hypothetical protein
MHDLLRARYRLACPARPDRGPRPVALSAFRRLQRLPGAAHPAVYRVAYSCDCGQEHVSLLAHGDLDYGPIAGPAAGEEERAAAPAFRNLLTGRMESVLDELVEVMRAELQRGNWPWRLYCSSESRLRPVFPSSLAMVSPARRRGGELVGVAMRCPACGELSLNLVSEAHLDVPFYHDRVVRFVERPFGDGRDLTLERFHEQLHSARFDAERGAL